MKKSILLSFLLISSLSAFSQITIDTTCYPKAGTNLYHYLLDTIDIQSLIKIEGPNKEWDFSNRLMEGFRIERQFEVPSNFAESVNFPNTNLAVDSSYQDSVIKFYQANKTGFYFLGVYQYPKNVLNRIYFYNIPSLTYKLPLAFGESFTSHAQSKSLSNFDETRSSHNIIKNVIVDGWGKIRLPDGVEKDVLRAKIIEISFDSVYNSYQGTWSISRLDTVTFYEWFTNKTDFPLQIFIRMSKYWGKFDISAVYSTSSLILSAENRFDNFRKKTFTAAPNPAQDFVRIKLDNPSENMTRISLVDIYGRSIVERRVDNVNELTLDLKEIKPGVYTILMQTETNQWSQKINIQ